MNTHTLVAILAVVVLPAIAIAQSGHSGHSGHSNPVPAAAQTDSPATKSFREANAKMHRDMEIRFSGDVDADFVRSMIPHHQGAIDMAKVALQHGQDDQTKRWATDVIREQEREIAEMQAWLKKRGL